jgi:CheY-like chemotaxis protein
MADVLIVDDSLMMRKFISMALAPEGYNLHEASGGQEAIDFVNTSPPDCMVLDLLMPDMVGTEVLETLKRENNVEFPIIVMTADIQESTQDTCMALGAYKVLTKPPIGEELCAAVKEAMAASGAN